MKANTFTGMRINNVRTTTQAIDIIRGFKQHSRMTETIIQARSFAKGHPIYDEMKHRQYTWSPFGTFDKKRSSENLIDLSGLVYFDIDTLNEGETLEALKERLSNCPHVYALWLSFGGRGLGGVIRCDLADKSDVYYVTGKFAEAMNIKIDAKVRHIAAQSVFTYDPEVYINEDATLFAYDSEQAKVETLKNQESLSISMQNPNKKWWETGQTDKIVFKTRLDASEYSPEKDYVLKPEGQPYCEVYIPKGGISEGSRNNILISICNKLIVNSPNATKAELETVMQTINRKYCHPYLDIEEVKCITEWCWENKLKQNVLVSYKERKIWIDPYKKLTTKQKKSIVGKGTGILRRMRMETRLREAIHQLQKNGYDVTKAELSSQLGISTRHMHRIWNQYDQLINELLANNPNQSVNPNAVVTNTNTEIASVTPTVPQDDEETEITIGCVTSLIRKTTQVTSELEPPQSNEMLEVDVADISHDKNLYEAVKIKEEAGAELNWIEARVFFDKNSYHMEKLLLVKDNYTNQPVYICMTTFKMIYPDSEVN